MRARNIKPAFFKNDELAELSFETRLLFQGLWCCADREGFLEYRPKRIKAEIFPYDNVGVEKLLEDLHTARFINFYVDFEPESGICGEKILFLSVVNFSKHQSPHKNEKDSEIKPLADNQEITRLKRNEHQSTRPDRGLRIEDRGLRKNTGVKKTPKKKKATPKFDPLSAKPVCVDDKLWSGFLGNRKHKKLENTELALSIILKSMKAGEQAGYTFTEMIEAYVSSGMQKFKVEWMKDKPRGAPKPRTPREEHNQMTRDFAREMLAKGAQNANDTHNGLGGHNPEIVEHQVQRQELLP